MSALEGAPVPVKAPGPMDLVDGLARLRFKDVFNPYSDFCPHYDLPDAPAIRRTNLLSTFEAAASGIDELWIALEPGHRGARRTGLAMTDEQRLAAHASRWGVEVRRATRAGPETEQTAGIVWDALAGRAERILLWNVFPLHCHEPGRALSNRRHSARERDACRELTEGMVAMVRPQRIVAIGRDAQAAMAGFGYQALAVRHPSYGGKAEFLLGVTG